MKSYLILLICLLSSGTFGQWAKNIGGTAEEKGNAIAVDGSGNVYIAGYFRGTVDFDPSPTVTYELTADNGYGDIFFAKYASDGSFLWANSIGGADEDAATSIAVDASGNVYLAGCFSGSNIDFNPGAGTNNLSSFGGWDIFFARYTTDGAYVWANNIGGATNDKATCIKLDGSGNVIVAGNFSSSNVDFNTGSGTATLSPSGSLDIFFIKYSIAGVFSWAKKIGGTGGDEVNSMFLDSGGNIYLTGYFSGADANFNPLGTANLTYYGGFDIFFAKYTSLGAFSWAKSIGGTGQDRGHSIAVDAGGNVYVAGAFSSGNADMDPDAGTQNIFCEGLSDGFLAKYNSSGAYAWKISIGKVGLDEVKSIVLDAGSNVYVTGYYGSSNVDFDPAAPIVNLANSGNTDIYIAKYTTAGALSWTKGIGGSGTEEPYSLVSDGTYLYMTGYYNSSPFDSDPAAGANNLANNGSYDVIYAKYKLADGQLPVEMNSFTAKANSNSVELSWETATEVNNYGFEVERVCEGVSVRGYEGSWETIGFVQGHGNSNSPNKYSFIDRTVTTGEIQYRLKQLDNDGRFKYYDAISVTVGAPKECRLFQNSPNPFNPSTAIKFQLTANLFVTVRICDQIGREVITLIKEQKPAGSHIVYWNGKDRNGSSVSNGVYFYTITAGNYCETKKMNLLK